MSEVWTLETAAQLCRMVEDIAPSFGAHVALTGGCLYKDGERKDVDLVFYCIRQCDAIDEQGLLDGLALEGFSIGKQHGWVYKAMYEGKEVDLFFPEAYPAGIPRDEQGEPYNR
jgi:hypothetical protein